MKFTLTIELGNDAMQTRSDIEETLRKLGQNLAYMCDPPESGDDGPIMDGNGNTVGTWAVEADDADERTRTGNTPTCEDCGEVLDHCTCEPYRCKACGREELICSLNPCPAVIADRES